jgi:L-aspartate oxidase
LFGRTNLPGLYAAGEAACTGVHGANRLASNSLLEGLVFGARAAQAMLDDKPPQGQNAEAPLPQHAQLTGEEETRLEEIITTLQASMWAYAGLLRDEQTLRQGFAAQESCAADLEQLGQGKQSRRLVEAHAMSGVARVILASALARTESRGAHFRNDFPKRDDENLRKHSVVGSDGKVVFEEW